MHQRSPRRGGQFQDVQVEKRLEFFPVGVFFLHIDMPEQRPCRPLRTDERIFATHRVEIAAPEQPVVIVLADEGQDLHGQRTAPGNIAHAQRLFAKPGLNVTQHAPFGYQQVVGAAVGGQHVQPTGHAGVFVGEQRNQPGIVFWRYAQALQKCLACSRVLLERVAL
ncbi:hypothetical protein D3C84_739500 [compost metagenome]